MSVYVSLTIWLYNASATSHQGNSVTVGITAGVELQSLNYPVLYTLSESWLWVAPAGINPPSPSMLQLHSIPLKTEAALARLVSCPLFLSQPHTSTLTIPSSPFIIFVPRPGYQKPEASVYVNTCVARWWLAPSGCLHACISSDAVEYQGREICWEQPSRQRHRRGDRGHQTHSLFCAASSNAALNKSSTNPNAGEKPNYCKVYYRSHLSYPSPSFSEIAFLHPHRDRASCWRGVNVTFTPSDSKQWKCGNSCSLSRCQQSNSCYFPAIIALWFCVCRDK